MTTWTSKRWSTGLRAFGFYNAGQDCTAACRIYAGEKIYDKLVADLSSAVSTIKLNDPDDTLNEIGPLISRRQRDRVASFVERAAELPHIEITTGGKPASERGFFFQPTVIAGAHAGGRDRPPRGVRTGGVDYPVQGPRGRHRLGQ